MVRYDNELIYKDIAPIIEKSGFQVVEIKGTERREGIHIMAVIYKPDGVTIDDCAEIHRLIKPRIELIMDRSDVRLEVASPGISRTIRNSREYSIFTGKGLKILKKGSKKWISGVIDTADDNIVMLNKGTEKMSVTIKDIQKAKLDYTQEVT
jgi:ribosome maturation factor RimP